MTPKTYLSPPEAAPIAGAIPDLPDVLLADGGLIRPFWTGF